MTQRDETLKVLKKRGVKKISTPDLTDIVGFPLNAIGQWMQTPEFKHVHVERDGLTKFYWYDESKPRAAKKKSTALVPVKTKKLVITKKPKEIYAKILGEVDGTVILLDQDNRVIKGVIMQEAK